MINDMTIAWNPSMSLAAVEKQVIQKCLEYYRGNKSQVARILGVTVKTIDRRIEQYAKEAEEQIERDVVEEKKRLERLRLARGYIPPGSSSGQYRPSVHDPRFKP